MPIHTIRYAGANHSWDGLYPVHFLPRGTSSRECGVVHWDIATWAVRSELTGKTMTAPQTIEFFNACTVRGVHVGRNNAAARQSRLDVLEFTRHVFFDGR